MKIKFADNSLSDIAAFLIDKGGKLSAAAKTLDDDVGGLLSEAAKQARFEGKLGQVAVVVLPKGAKAKRAVLLGGGKPADRKGRAAEKIGGSFVKSQAMAGFKTAAIYADKADAAARIAAGVRLAAYRFDTYFTKKTPDDLPSLNSVTMVCEDTRSARAQFAPMDAAIDGTYFARDLVNEPPNVLYPAEFAKRLKALQSLGLEVEVLGEKDLKKHKMGSMLGVGPVSYTHLTLPTIYSV